MRAVIVGGSRGIGAACARRLQADGWDTVDLSRTSGVDVTHRADLDAALDGLGQVDALIYSAGHVLPAPFLDVTDADWAYTLEVNLTAPARCLRWFAERQSRGAVVLIASTAALRPSPGWSAYAAAKAGLVELGVTAAVELAPDHRVYVVAPGRCATALRRVLAPEEDPDSIMQPPEVADVVAMLIADEAGVLAGQPIEVKRR